MTQPEISKPEGQKLTPERLYDMGFAFKQTGTLIAAIELNLFTKVAESPTEPAEIAEKIGLPANAAERLMIACATIGLLEKRGSKYVNAPDVDRYMVKGRPPYFGDFLVYQTRMEYDGWKDLATKLRPPQKTYEAMQNDPEAARTFTLTGYETSKSPGYKLAREFDFSSYSLWLDLGGGSGAYSIAACLRYPHLRAIVFDHANVCAVAEEFIAQAGVSDRMKTHPGNYVTDEFPRGGDLISYLNSQPGGAADFQFLLNKAFDALEPGGGIIYIDYILNDDKTGPTDPVFRHLGGALSSSNPSSVYSGAEVCEYLGKAGFVDTEVRDFVPGMLGMVTAKKPK